MIKQAPYDSVVFVSKPRCASTSIFEHIYMWDDETMGSKPLYHMPAVGMMRNLGSKKWKDCTTFAVIRNPIDLVISWYQHHKFGRPSKNTASYYPDDINTWVGSGFKTHWGNWANSCKKTNPLLQTNWTHHENQQIVDFMIRLEDQDWKGFEESSGISMSKLPQRNQSPKVNEHVLTEKSLSVINEFFHQDFETYKY